MNKRIISLMLSFCMIVSSLAFPALAEENTNWIDLLDFGGVNGTSSNSLIVLDNASFYYMLPERMTVGYIDIVFYSNRGINAITDSYGNELTLVQLDSYYYRAYGNIPRETNSRIILNIDATSNTANTSITFLSVRAGSFYTSNVYPLGFNFSIRDGGPIRTGTVNAGSGSDLALRFTDSSDKSLQTYSISFFFNQWKTYDVIDLVISGEIYQVDSLAANIGGVYVPLSLGMELTTQENLYFKRVSLSLDLSNIDKNVSQNEPLEIVVSGLFAPGAESQYVDIDSAVGLVFGNSVEPEIFWFTKLVNTISTWGQNIVDAITGNGAAADFNQGVSDANDKLSDASDAMNDFTRPAADSVVPDLGEYDSSAVSMLSGFLSNELFSPLITAGLAIWLIGIIFGV